MTPKSIPVIALVDSPNRSLVIIVVGTPSSKKLRMLTTKLMNHVIGGSSAPVTMIAKTMGIEAAAIALTEKMKLTLQSFVM